MLPTNHPTKYIPSVLTATWAQQGRKSHSLLLNNNHTTVHCVCAVLRLIPKILSFPRDWTTVAVRSSVLQQPVGSVLSSSGAPA